MHWQRANCVRSFTVSRPSRRLTSKIDDHAISYFSANAAFSGCVMSIIRKLMSPASICPAKQVSATSFAPFSMAVQVTQRFAPWKQSTSTPSLWGSDVAVFRGLFPQAASTTAASTATKIVLILFYSIKGSSPLRATGPRLPTRPFHRPPARADRAFCIR